MAKSRRKKFEPDYLYTNKNSPVRFSTSNKVLKYIESHTKKGSQFQKDAIKKWVSYARKIAVGTHKETHFNKKRQYHFYHYGDKNSLFAVDLCDLFGGERDRIALLNSGFKYFFMFINALTKHLIVHPIKSREGSEILKAFKESLLKSGLSCEREGPSCSIHVDQEFLTKQIKELCKNNCVNIYY